MIKIFTSYILPFIFLLAAELFYFKIAVRYNIIDKPNERSSHSVATIRGGGVIFLLAALLFFFWSGYRFPFLFLAMMLSGIVSFIDDIKTLPNSIKFSAHIGSVILLFVECGILTSLPPLFLLIICILVLGVINAYNFMDGINGITGLYSMAIVVPLFITENDEQLRSLEFFTIAGLVVFSFFNARTKARCFAGDVGSISLAILIVFLIMVRIKQTGSFIYFGLLLIYGIDSVFTIAQRLFQGENIFKPHRKHLYQYLSNERKIPQLWVSGFFAFLQLIISLGIVCNFFNLFQILIVFIIMAIIYWLIKIPFITNFKKN